MSKVFEVCCEDHQTHARQGVLHTRRGDVATPAFMPVGTQAAVKTVTPEEVAATGAEIILANTYHLMLRPGVEIIRKAGGVHSFMSWSGPVLTDSGGFQVFSLSDIRKLTERGVEFRSHIDGRKMELTPEQAIDLQISFESDVIMPLDVLTGYESSDEEQDRAAEQTQRWLDRCVDHFSQATRHLGDLRPLLFGITQGGFDAARRSDHARRTAERDLDGYSIGGLSVGESKDELFRMLEASIQDLPEEKPRYLMGVGSPEDLWIAVSHGVDMFDCVHPTRVARRGAFFTRTGRVNITTARFRSNFDPIDPSCDCYTCRTFSAAYIHHLFRSGEMLAPRLATIHNLRFFQDVMTEIRGAIARGDFVERHTSFLQEYHSVDDGVRRDQRLRWDARRQRRMMSDGGTRG